MVKLICLLGIIASFEVSAGTFEEDKQGIQEACENFAELWYYAHSGWDFFSEWLYEKSLDMDNQSTYSCEHDSRKITK